MPQFDDKVLLFENESTSVYRSHLSDTNDEIIIKTPKGSDYSGIYNEFNLLSEEKLSFQVLKVENVDNKPSLIRSYLPGLSLKALIEQGEFGLDFFLDYAAAIARQLQDIQARGITHKDISSHNIIIDPVSKSATIIDFESSVKTRVSTVPLYESTRLIGNLLYSSPEQTGRMNRSLDYRTDFYSLGIVFYEMLTGQLPFQSEDLLELVHSHIAKMPPRMDTFDKNIPSVIIDIVGKLTAKNAEERYQSMEGLLSDLHQCKNLWSTHQAIPHFPIAQFDIPLRLHISQTMVGREAERDQILKLFSQAIEGDKVFLTVGGLSGIGKSTLICETAKPLTEYKGIILSGKFDQLQKNIPYYAWIKAFSQFADTILSEPPHVLAEWRVKLFSSLQGMESVLVQIAPKLGKVLGLQDHTTELSAVELKNRLQYGVGLFLSLLATPHHPLILFLDDWQWADEDSIRLLESILMNPTLNNLMLVAAYRTNEVSSVHPFYPIVRDCSKKPGQSLHEPVFRASIDLYPLTEEDSLTLLANTLNRPKENLKKLSTTIYAKTQGNPFLAGELLSLLFNKKLLWMDAITRQWEWDFDSIQKLTISDNAVDFILKNNENLPKETLEALKIASAVGRVFSLEKTAEVLSLKPSVLHRKLWPAIQNNSIVPARSNYKYLPEFYESENSDVYFRFSHDRIQQALYQEIDPKTKESLHFKIGNCLIKYAHDQEQLFESANHFLKCPGSIAQSPDIPGISSILQKAGRRAYQSAAFDVSYQYFALWDSLQKEICEQTLGIYWMLIETAHLSGRVEESFRYENTALSLCKNQAERSQTFETMINSYTATDQMLKATEIARKALAELGIRIPEKARKWQIIYQAIRSRILLSDAKIATISEWDDMTNTQYKWAMRLLKASLSSYFLIKFETYPILIFKMVDLNTRYGNTREAIIGFGSYGLILAGILNSPEIGYTAGKQALKLLEKYKADDLIAQAGFVDSTFIAHWKEPLHEMGAKCHNYYRLGLSQGDIWYSGWNLYMGNVIRVYVGEKATVLIDSLNGQETFFQQHNLTNLWHRTQFELYFAKKIRYPDYTDDDFNWKKNIQIFLDSVDLTGLFTVHSMHTIYSILVGDYQKAWEMSLLAEKYSESVKSVFSYNYFQIYQAIAGLSIYKNADTATQKKIRTAAKRSKKFTAKLVSMQAGNYKWGAEFLEAETQRVLHKNFSPSVYYQAIESARKGQMVLPALIIRLQLVRIMMAVNHPDRFDEIEKVRAELINWEMEGITHVLNETFKSYPSQSGGVNIRGLVSASRGSSTQYISDLQIDSLTFIKSIETLTGELQLEKLLHRLMNFALENAGADFGCFLLRRGTNFETVVQMYADGKATTGDGEVPPTIFNYVVQSHEPLMLSNASETAPFSTDPLVIKNSERSILCIPFTNKGQINGVIYLTNRLTENAFTEGRVGLLKVLAGQISLSIENALLYENMENLVKERTSQLENEKKKSDRLLLNVLPEQVANELKRSGKAKPKYYKEVTIMFCDFKNFTNYAEIEKPEALIEELDYCFKAFDAIISKYNIEKIKTIGDAYLCVSGLPQANPNHACDIVNAAIDLQNWMQQETIKRNEMGKGFLELRIGIHTGSVVAGVVGATKFAFDIWGDAVNTAARMEQTSEAGKINISADTYEAIREKYKCEARGKIQAKNKGEIEMYFVLNTIAVQISG